MERCTLVLALLSMLAVSHALYSSSGPVLSLSKKTFKSQILESDLPAVVEFFAPWCGHCQQLAPIYTKVANNLQGMVTVAAIDCDEESNKKLCSKYGVKGFPTLKLFPASAQKNPYTGKMDKNPTDYQGPRSAKAIADSALALLPDTFITGLKGASAFEKFKEASEMPKVILASTKSRATPLYKSLSLSFKGRLAFALVKDSETDVLSSLGISETPALVVLTPDGETVKYDGAMKAKELTSFLKKYALDSPAQEPDASKEDRAEKPDAEAEDSEDPKDKAVPQVVKDMTFEELDAASTAEDPLLVAFVKDKEAASCKEALAQFNKIVSGLGELIHAAQIQVSDASAAEAAKYSVDAAALGTDPCKLDIVLLPFDEDKGGPEEWQHFLGEMNGRELQKFALEGFPSFVTRVTDSTMQQFMSPDMGTPRVFLFTDKDETPAVYAALSVNLRRYKYRFADVHKSDKALMQQFNVKKVPSLVVSYAKPGTEEELIKEGKLGVQTFPGPLKYPYMHSFLSTFAGMLGALPEGEPDPMDFTEKMRTATKADSSAPPKDVPQASTQTELYDFCLKKSSGLCVLALLDASSPSFAEHTQIASAAAGRWERQPLQFSWIDAARQPTFITAFGLTKTDLPTLVAFHPKKLRGAQLKGSYSAQSIDALLDGLFSGTIHSAAFQDLPALVEGGEQDAADMEPVEEEFDLADVLGEDVAGSGSKEDLLKQADKELEEEERQRREKEAAEKASAAGGKKKSSKRKKSKKSKASKEEL